MTDFSKKFNRVSKDVIAKAMLFRDQGIGISAQADEGLRGFVTRAFNNFCVGAKAEPEHARAQLVELFADMIDDAGIEMDDPRFAVGPMMEQAMGADFAQRVRGALQPQAHVA